MGLWVGMGVCSHHGWVGQSALLICGPSVAEGPAAPPLSGPSMRVEMWHQKEFRRDPVESKQQGLTGWASVRTAGHLSTWNLKFINTGSYR